MIKKYISVFITVLMIFSCAAYADDAKMSIGINPEHAEAVEIMTGLFLAESFEQSGKDPNGAVSRCEFIYQLNVFDRGVDGELMLSFESPFLDVSFDHKYYKDIAYAASMGYVSVSARFEPDRAITVAEAMTVAVRRLGYEVYAQLKGGYPGGYLAVASDLELDSGISGDVLTASGAIALLYNMSLANVNDISSFQGEAVSYESGKPLMEASLGFIRAEGRADCIGNETLGVYSCEKNQVVIDGEIYEMGFCRVPDVIGERIIYYYTEDFDGISGNTLLYMAADENANDYIRIDAKDVSSVSGGVISYEDSGRSKSVTVKADCDILYNGRPLSENAESIIASVKRGSFTFVSTANGGDELLKIESSTDYAVKRYSSYDECIAFKNGLPVYVRDETELRLTLPNGVVSANAESLKENDIVSLRISSDGLMIKGEVSRETVSGTVTEVSDDEITVNGVTYTLSPNLDKTLVKPGFDAVFYLTAAGEIAYIDKDASSTTFKRGVAVRMAASSGVESKVRIELLCEDGRISEFFISDKMEIDGVAVKDFSDQYENYLRTGSTRDEFSGLWGEGYRLYRNLIRYKLNSDGEIKEIDTARYNVGIEDPNDTLICIGNGFESENDGKGNEIKKEIVANKSAGITAESQKYVKALMKLSGNTDVYIKESTVAFYAAANLSNWNSKDYRVQSAASLGNSKTYWMMSYKECVDDVCADVIVNYKDKVLGDFSPDTSPVIITDIRTALDEDGDEIKKIEYSGLNGKKLGTFQSFCRNNDVVLNVKPMVSLLTGDAAENESYVLQKGDLVRLQNSDTGEIEKIELIYRASEDKMVCPNPLGQSSSSYGTTGKSDYFRVIKAYAASMKEDFVSFSFDEPYEENGVVIIGDDGEIHRILDSLPIAVYEYNSRGGEVRQGSVSDLKTYAEFKENRSEIFLYTRYGEPKMIYIYQEG